MNKPLKCCLTAALALGLAVLPASVQANSAMLEWNQPPSFALSAEQGTDISVTEELLTFDFTRTSDNYDSEAQVTAQYRLFNPGGARKVRMGFPAVCRLDTLREAPPQVAVNGEAEQAVVYCGGETDPMREQLPGMTFEQSLEKMYEKSLPQAKGLLIEVTGAPTGNIALRIPNAQGIIFRHCGYGYDAEEERYEFFNRPSDSRVFRLYAVGAQAAQCLTKGYEMSSRSLDFEEFILANFSSSYPYLAELSRELLNFSDSRAKTFSNIGTPERRVENDVYFFEGKTRLVTFVYEAELLSGVNEFSVEYLAAGSYNGRYNPPKFSYTYLTNPAKNWADFQKLLIKILPGQGFRYLVESNLDFARQEDGSYTAEMSGLPEENLSFTMCDSENPVKRKDSSFGYYLIFFLFVILPFIVIAAVVVLVICLLLKRRKRKLS